MTTHSYIIVRACLDGTGGETVNDLRPELTDVLAQIDELADFGSAALSFIIDHGLLDQWLAR